MNKRNIAVMSILAVIASGAVLADPTPQQVSVNKNWQSSISNFPNALLMSAINRSKWPLMI